MANRNLPIGVFDSGIGGLTVVRALMDLLPNESLIYFGDTAHLPYGDKSPTEIEKYVRKIINFLLAKKVKLILIACNSASTIYDKIIRYLDRLPLINVIDPMIDHLKKYHGGKKIGLIGTKLTVNSDVYDNKLELNITGISLEKLATPLLVPLIENEFHDDQLLNLALEEYLSHPSLCHISTLILGCTHYPLIRDKIERFYKGRVDVLDAARITAIAVKQILEINSLLSNTQACHRFYLSSLTSGFIKKARKFFGEDLHIEGVGIL